MNQQPQSRIILVLQYVRRYVSLNSDCFANPHFRLYRAPQSGSSLHPLSLQLPCLVNNSNCANHQCPLNHIQDP